jgi:hypothetical protein
MQMTWKPCRELHLLHRGMTLWNYTKGQNWLHKKLFWLVSKMDWKLKYYWSNLTNVSKINNRQIPPAINRQLSNIFATFMYIHDLNKLSNNKYFRYISVIGMCQWTDDWLAKVKWDVMDRVGALSIWTAHKCFLPRRVYGRRYLSIIYFWNICQITSIIF